MIFTNPKFSNFKYLPGSCISGPESSLFKSPYSYHSYPGAAQLSFSSWLFVAFILICHSSFLPLYWQAQPWFNCLGIAFLGGTWSCPDVIVYFFSFIANLISFAVGKLNISELLFYSRLPCTSQRSIDYKSTCTNLYFCMLCKTFWCLQSSNGFSHFKLFQ